MKSNNIIYNGPLSTYVEIISGGTPRTSNREYWGGNIPWLSVKDFNNDKRFVYKTEKCITKLGLENSVTQLLRKNDIIISARGTVGAMAMIPFPMSFNQSCYGIRAKERYVHPSFLYYLLKSMIVEFKANTHGSVFDTITRETFDNINIYLPSLEIQDKIAYILARLDDKIELNDRVNDNLEEQANQIYRNTFIKNAKEKWNTGKLSDLIQIRYGKDHKILMPGEYPVFGSGGIMRYGNSFLYDKESVLIPRKGTLNNIIYIDEPFWSVDTMFYTIMKQSNIAKFIYYLLKSKDLASMNSGSAVPSMTTDILNSIELKIPDNITLLKFEDIVGPMFKIIKNNKSEIKTLIQLRNNLLPRLMSGEIDVSKIKI